MFPCPFWRLSSWISTYRCFRLTSIPHWGNSWIVTLGLVFVFLLWWIARFLYPMSFPLLIYSSVFLTLTFQLFPKRGRWAHEIFLVSFLACLQFLYKMSKQLINNLAGSMILGPKSFWFTLFTLEKSTAILILILCIWFFPLWKCIRMFRLLNKTL